jgi:uncharacterized delta-60 repeat protein
MQNLMTTLLSRALALPFLAALCLLTRPEALHARPGDLDTTFGTGGIVITNFPTNSHDNGGCVAVQSDGKILVAGASTNGSNVDFAMARYDASGSLDTTFHGTGRVTTDLGSNADYVYAMAVQGDGKILLAGASGNTFALVRYHGNAATGTPGTLDTAFGTGGIVLTTVLSFDSARSVAVQGDGNILVAGATFNGTSNDFALVRYKNDGSLDASFGPGGIVVTPVGSNYDYASGMALQADGKILVAGQSSNGTNYDFAVVRYHGAAATGTPGTLDSTFGTGGIVTTPIGSSDDFAYSVAVQGDGKIVLAGQSANGGNYDFALVRYRKDGSLDPAFGTGGIVTNPVGSGQDYASSVAVRGDGKILVAGSFENGNVFDFALVRYRNDGALDQSFGTGGIVTTIFPIASEAYGVAVQSDGKILVAGSSYNGTNYDFALARYEGDRSSRDFDGDGNEDLIFQNTVGQIYAWYLNGSGAIASSAYLFTSGLADWRVAGIADLNNDGHTDLVFQNNFGQIYAWYMNGNGAISSSAYLFTGGLADWRLKGIADLNNDGHADLVFQNTVGQIYVWYLNGAGVISSSAYLFISGLADWRVAAIADVNNDGNADIVFQNTVGQIYAWYLNGSGVISSSAYLFTSGLGDWRVAAIADVNNDGNADIVFQNTVGQIYAWYLNGGGVLSSSAYLFTSGLGDWRVR